MMPTTLLFRSILIFVCLVQSFVAIAAADDLLSGLNISDIGQTFQKANGDDYFSVYRNIIPSSGNLAQDNRVIVEDPGMKLNKEIENFLQKYQLERKDDKEVLESKSFDEFELTHVPGLPKDYFAKNYEITSTGQNNLLRQQVEDKAPEQQANIQYVMGPSIGAVGRQPQLASRGRYYYGGSTARNPRSTAGLVPGSLPNVQSVKMMSLNSVTPAGTMPPTVNSTVPTTVPTNTMNGNTGALPAQNLPAQNLPAQNAGPPGSKRVSTDDILASGQKLTVEQERYHQLLTEYRQKQAYENTSPLQRLSTRIRGPIDQTLDLGAQRAV